MLYPKQTGKPILQATKTKLKFYDGSVAHVLREYNANCKYKVKLYHLNFKVTHRDQHPLLSGAMCQELGLIKMDVVHTVQSTDIIDQYRDVFKGLGCLEKEYHIKLDPAVSHSQQPSRRVPVALKGQLKEKLDDLTKKALYNQLQSIQHGSTT